MIRKISEMPIVEDLNDEAVIPIVQDGKNYIVKCKKLMDLNNISQENNDVLVLDGGNAQEISQENS